MMRIRGQIRISVAFYKNRQYVPLVLLILNTFLASLEGSMHTAPIVHASTSRVEPCYFLRLRRELRDKVYRFVLRTSFPINWVEHSYAAHQRENIEDWAQENQKTYNTILDRRLLRTEKQIFEEGREIFYSENQIQLKTPFSVNVPLEALKNIPNLKSVSNENTVNTKRAFNTTIKVGVVNKSGCMSRTNL